MSSTNIITLDLTVTVLTLSLLGAWLVMFVASWLKTKDDMELIIIGFIGSYFISATHSALIQYFAIFQPGAMVDAVPARVLSRVLSLILLIIIQRQIMRIFK